MVDTRHRVLLLGEREVCDWNRLDQPYAIFRTVKLVAIAVHCAARNGEHYRAAMAQPHLGRGGNIGREMNVLA